MVVVGPDAGDLAGGVEELDLRCLVAARVVDVVEDDGFEAEECVEEFEAEVGNCLKAACEVGAQLIDAAHVAVTLQQALGDRGCEDDISRVVGEDSVEVVGVPRGDPICGEGMREGWLEG